MKQNVTYARDVHLLQMSANWQSAPKKPGWSGGLGSACAERSETWDEVIGGALGNEDKTCLKAVNRSRT